MRYSSDLPRLPLGTAHAQWPSFVLSCPSAPPTAFAVDGEGGGSRSSAGPWMDDGSSTSRPEATAALGGTWMACARVDFLSTAAGHKPSKSATRANAQETLRRFDLDPSETLLHLHTCLIPPGAASASPSGTVASGKIPGGKSMSGRFAAAAVKAVTAARFSSSSSSSSSSHVATPSPSASKPGVPVTCTLCMTPSFLCIGSSLGSYTYPWAEIDVIRKGAITQARLPSSIELVLSSGRSFAIGGLMDRAKVISQMQALRKTAREETMSGLAQWQPRRLVLHSPLCITSLLPCPISLEMEQKREELMSSEGRGSKHATATHGVERLSIQPGASLRLHSLHISTPLTVRMWLDGGSYDTARLRGETTFERPPGQCEFDLKMILCPPDEKRPLASSRAVVLRATVSISHEGCCVLTFVAPYWLVNTSSLPLRVYNARDTADHMVEAPARSQNALLLHMGGPLDQGFSGLGPVSRSSSVASVLGSSSTGSVRLGVAPAPAPAPPSLFDVAGGCDFLWPGQRATDLDSIASPLLPVMGAREVDLIEGAAQISFVTDLASSACHEPTSPHRFRSMPSVRTAPLKSGATTDPLLS